MSITKQSFYKYFTVILISCLLLALPGGCGNSRTVSSPPDEESVLNLFNIDPHTLDPAISGDSTSHQYVTQIFSGLLRLDDNMEPGPDIASDWSLSKGGTTYTFNLRHDVKFHDGTPVKAADFKYSWERACNPATGSLTAETYLGDIVGVNEMLAGEADEISGVVAVNDYTLEVTIDAPKSYFLYKLAYPTTFVVDGENVKSGREWWRNPNGTGPFKLDSWDEGTQLVLKWNDGYYGDTPGVSSVIFNLWGGVPFFMYETGEIDVTGVPVPYIDRVTDEAGPFHDELEILQEFSFYFLGFNTEKPPFDDLNIRLAFSMAVNREKLASLIFRDMVEPAYGIVPPGMPGYNENLKGYSYDPVQARKLIAESKYGDAANLPPITLTTAGWGGVISQELEAIIDGWRKDLGVEVTVRQLEPDRYIYHLLEEKDELIDMGWIADFPHPQGFLAVLFQSGVKNNYGGYSNPEVDSLLKQASLEQDTEASLALYQQVEQMLVDDAACVPLWFGENYILVKPYVEGYYLNPLGIAMLDKVTVNKQ